MKVSFEGLGEVIATFYNSESKTADKGEPVKLSGNGEVCSCNAGDSFAGVAVSGDGDFVGVQLNGFVKLPYTGTAPSLGKQSLVADGNGGVKVTASGGDDGYLVLGVDTDASLVGFMM